MLQVRQLGSDVRYNDNLSESGYREPKLFVTYWEVTIEGREQPVQLVGISRGSLGDQTGFYLYTMHALPKVEEINLLGFPKEKTYDYSAVRYHEPMTPRTVCDAVADWLGLVPTYSYAQAQAQPDVPTETEQGKGRRRWPRLSRS